MGFFNLFSSHKETTKQPEARGTNEQSVGICPVE